MGLILNILFLVGSLSTGWLLTTWLELKSGLEKIGASMLLGFWLVTMGMMIAYHITGSFSRELTLGIIGFLNIALGLAIGNTHRKHLFEELLALPNNMRSTLKRYRQVWSVLNRLERLLLTVVALCLGQTAWSNLTWPVADWDSIALYDFRAILIKLVGHWDDGKKMGYFYHYPPFTSLLHGAVYLMGTDRVKIVYTLLFVSFLLLFYAFLRKQTQRSQAIIGVFLLTISPLVSDHLTVAYTNLPYTIYFCAGVLYAWRWLADHNPSDMKLAFLFTAISCWIRVSEPFWMIILVMLLAGRLFIVKNISWRTVALFTVLFIGLVRYWPEYIRYLDLPAPPPVSAQATGLIDAVTPITIVQHAFTVSMYLFTNAVRPLSTLLLPVLVIILYDTKLKQTKYFRYPVLTLLLLCGTVAAGTYFFSFTYNTWDAIGPSLTRMMMTIVPLLIYFVSISSFWENIFKYVTFSIPTVHKPKKR